VLDGGVFAMTPLTVACLYVRGEYPYAVDYVRRLHAMVARWIDRPFRMVCLTDQPSLMPGSVEPIPITKFENCFAYWNKLQLFSPVRRWSFLRGQRVLYLDLDTLVVAPLAPIIDVPAPFALTADPVRPGQRTRDRYNRQIIRRFNSSVMVFDGGTHIDLYNEWTPTVAQRLSGDQDWIGERVPKATALPRAWFPRLSEVVSPPFHPDVKVILTKHPKNHIAVHEYSWLEPLWGAA
jgi:hypothetical protein